jgi:hypothetical protein
LPNRRRSSTHLALLLALSIAGCATGRDGTFSEQEKSPLVATLLAIFPGFFWHGLGNRYAGKGSKSTDLLEEEGLGAGCMVLGAGIGGLGYLEQIECEKSKNEFELVMNRIGEVTSFIACGGFLGYGLILFFDSWIKDIASAADAVREHNRELERKFDLTPSIPHDANISDETSATSSGGHTLDVGKIGVADETRAGAPSAGGDKVR